MDRPSFWLGQHVIITGASSGLGWALAEHLAARGAKVGLLARRSDKLDELAARLRSAGAQTATASADVIDTPGTKAAIGALEQALGPCDVLIANAGVHIYSPGDDFLAENANAVIATNVQGVINSLAAVLPGMVQRRRGRVVAVASIAAVIGLPWVGAYSASKAAVVKLMESLDLDLRRHGVRTTTICPGFIDTPMIAGHDPRAKFGVLSAPTAAARICRAIERDRRQFWFPRGTYLLARIGRMLPFGLYRRVVADVPRPSGLHG